MLSWAFALGQVRYQVRCGPCHQGQLLLLWGGGTEVKDGLREGSMGGQGDCGGFGHNPGGALARLWPQETVRQGEPQTGGKGRHCGVHIHGGTIRQEEEGRGDHPSKQLETLTEMGNPG